MLSIFIPVFFAEATPQVAANVAEEALRKVAKGVKREVVGNLQIEGASAKLRDLVIDVRPRSGSSADESLRQFSTSDLVPNTCKSLTLRPVISAYNARVIYRYSAGRSVPPVDVEIGSGDCDGYDARLRSTAVPAPTGLQNFEFKGIRSTDTAAMHFGKWGSILRTLPACQTGTGRFGIPTMYCSFADHELSGARFTMSAGFEPNGVLREISGLSDVEYQSVVVRAFEQKYGRYQSSEVISFQDWIGREAKINQYTWKFNDGTLTIGPDLSSDRKKIYTKFLFMTTPYERAVEEMRRRTAIRPKVDF